MKIVTSFIKAVLKTAITGTAGALAYTWLWGYLLDKYHMEDNDMHGWVLLAFPTGFLLGAVTGGTLFISDSDDRDTSGIYCIVIPILVTCIHAALLVLDRGTINFRGNLVISGVALVWSAALLFRGLWLFSHRRDSND